MKKIVSYKENFGAYFTPANTGFSQAGYSLIELMIGLSLGLVMIIGITSLYVQSSHNYDRLSDEATRISNTQYLSGLFRQEIQGAGYWGDFTTPNAEGTLINPCLIDTASLAAAVDQPVYGFDSPGASPLACLPNGNFVAGTDVLVLRRASSQPLSPLNPAVTGEVYIHANPQEYVVEVGDSGGYVAPELDAGNGVANIGTSPAGNAPSIMTKKNNPDAATPDYTMRVAADSRKYNVSIIFVSPCTIPANNSDLCTGPDDDGGNPFPSLKKLELSAQSGGLQFDTIVLAEGVENMQIQYGIDISAPNSLGSGSPNYYTQAPTIPEWENVVTIRVAALLRDEVPSQFPNNNTYTLLDTVLPPFGDRFVRQVFDGTYRIQNISQRRAGSN